MIFRFLRQYFRDDEFEQIHHQLTESNLLLSEYKAFIHEQKKPAIDEGDKVDADFLALIWASLAVGLAFGSESVDHLPDRKVVFDSLNNAVWSIFAVVTFIFIILNLISAIKLTMKYADAKKDTNVKSFAVTLFIGVVILAVGLIILSFVQEMGL